MKQYLELCQHVLDNGVEKHDRTGTGTLSVFGHQMRFNLQDGFPLVTTKKLHLKSIVHELLWFLSGDTNIKYLKDNGVRIWDDWADKDGNLGPVYGKQWRSWTSPRMKMVEEENQYFSLVNEEIDQIDNVVKGIKSNPDSRRHLVIAYNPSDVDHMALPPCHSAFQFYVANGKLSCQLYQRSTDVFLGLPFNIASYALFTMMVAQVCNLEYGEFIHTSGDTHIYLNHVDQVKLQLTREPHPLPTMKINPSVRDIFSFQYEDFELVDYVAHPHIKGVVSV